MKIIAERALANCPHLTKAQILSLLRGPGKLHDYTGDPKTELPLGPVSLVWIVDFMMLFKIAEYDALSLALGLVSDDLFTFAETLPEWGPTMVPPRLDLFVEDGRYLGLSSNDTVVDLKTFELKSRFDAPVFLRKEVYNLVTLIGARLRLTQKGNSPASSDPPPATPPASSPDLYR